ncbi:MAG TPA: HutD family protein [Thermoanaerobaculia bacterium]
MPLVVRTDSISSQPWRNGGGRTRELLAWPSADDWALRISVADIEADGPFSAFPGVERWFAVIEGAGVVLRFGDDERIVTPDDSPLRFDGATAPDCRLIDGPTRDLNLMLHGATGAMERVVSGQPWSPAAQQGGLFAAVAGRWTCGDGSGGEVAARTLVWFERLPAESVAFQPFDVAAAGPLGWWLSFTPQRR